MKTFVRESLIQLINVSSVITFSYSYEIIDPNPEMAEYRY